MRALIAEPGDDGIIATGVDNIDQLNQEFGVTGFDPLLEPIADASGVSVRSMAGRRPAIMGIYVVSFTDPADPAMVAAAYQAEPNVVYSEPNYYVYASETNAVPVAFAPNDPFFDRQWDPQAIPGTPGRGTSRAGRGVVVAVVDLGRGLCGRRAVPPRTRPGANQLVPGYDFVNNDPHPSDDFGHGTRCRHHRPEHQQWAWGCRRGLRRQHYAGQGARCARPRAASTRWPRASYSLPTTAPASSTSA
ncbi:MAG: hypothetical protein M5U09_26840 [Gammaproteobacteria bacterium]|nr:hypothetical protein [Gammaproteobacteria bacterium]